MVAYSDGSLVALPADGDTPKRGATGWGFTVRQGQNTMVVDKGALEKAEVFDAGAEGALQALRSAIARHPSKLLRSAWTTVTRLQ